MRDYTFNILHFRRDSCVLMWNHIDCSAHSSVSDSTCRFCVSWLCELCQGRLWKLRTDMCTVLQRIAIVWLEDSDLKPYTVGYSLVLSVFSFQTVFVCAYLNWHFVNFLDCTLDSSWLYICDNYVLVVDVDIRGGERLYFGRINLKYFQLYKETPGKCKHILVINAVNKYLLPNHRFITSFLT